MAWRTTIWKHGFNANLMSIARPNYAGLIFRGRSDSNIKITPSCGSRGRSSSSISKSISTPSLSQSLASRCQFRTCVVQNQAIFNPTSVPTQPSYIFGALSWSVFAGCPSSQRSFFTSAFRRQSEQGDARETHKQGHWSQKDLSQATSDAHIDRREVVSQPNLDSTSAPAPPSASKAKSISEDIRTLPNLLTLARIASTPFLGYMILTHDMKSATILLFFAGFTDWLDGYLARRWNSYTVFGSIADPAADKILMTTMVVCLAKGGLMPAPLAAVILGRDVALIISAFIIRFRSLPPPRTFSRYWDFTLPSASVHPTTLSKYNTFLQLLLVGTLTVLPVCPTVLQEFMSGYPLDGFMWLVALTTIASGASYLGGGGSRSVNAKVTGSLKDRLEKGIKGIGKKKE